MVPVETAPLPQSNEAALKTKEHKKRMIAIVLLVLGSLSFVGGIIMSALFTSAMVVLNFSAIVYYYLGEVLLYSVGAILLIIGLILLFYRKSNRRVTVITNRGYAHNGPVSSVYRNGYNHGTTVVSHNTFSGGPSFGLGGYNTYNTRYGNYGMQMNPGYPPGGPHQGLSAGASAPGSDVKETTDQGFTFSGKSLPPPPSYDVATNATSLP